MAVILIYTSILRNKEFKFEEAGGRPLWAPLKPDSVLMASVQSLQAVLADASTPFQAATKTSTTTKTTAVNMVNQHVFVGVVGEFKRFVATASETALDRAQQDIADNILAFLVRATAERVKAMLQQDLPSTSMIPIIRRSLVDEMGEGGLVTDENLQKYLSAGAMPSLSEAAVSALRESGVGVCMTHSDGFVSLHFLWCLWWTCVV